MFDCSLTENYFKEKNRMTKNCKIVCENCPLAHSVNRHGLSCKMFQNRYSLECIAIVQKWSDEHPWKTYVEYFMEKHPNAPLSGGNYPDGLCPCDLGLGDNEDCKKYEKCEDCWNEEMEVDISENK